MDGWPHTPDSDQHPSSLHGMTIAQLSSFADWSNVSTFCLLPQLPNGDSQWYVKHLSKGAVHAIGSL